MINVEPTIVVFVDGFLIRSSLDSNFGILHTHYPDFNRYFPTYYIPEDEIWVDHLYRDEVEFLKGADRLTDTLMASNDTASYNQIHELAKEALCEPGPVPEFVKSREANDGMTIAYVDGGIVRRYLDPEFLLGGHDLVYSYIPKGEIWVDAKMDPREYKYLINHELTERRLMDQGKSYDVAHEYASVTEKEFRRADGTAFYPGDPNYPWRNLSREDILKHYYVVK